MKTAAMFKLIFDRSQMMKRLIRIFTLAMLSLLPLGCASQKASGNDNNSPNSNTHHPSGFVYADGNHFALDGHPFYIAGANHHYLHFAYQQEVQNFLDDAAMMNINAVRLLAFIDKGSLDGTTRPTTWDKYDNSTYQLNTNGIYFQYWDTNTNSVKYNDGPNGLQHLDYAVSECRKRGLKVILCLTNNWLYTGGIPQYLSWFGMSDSADHNRFFTDSRCKTAYKNWINHLVNRTNYDTGVCYKDDPTILSWELMNEPEADGAPISTLTNWASEMSAYLKSLDPNHMVGLGEQGYFSGRGSDWKYNGGTGTSFDDLLRISTLDWGSYHLYPGYWSETADWGQNTWIPEHVNAGNTVNKPVILAEFGWKGSKDTIYGNWCGKIETLNSNWIVWRLISKSQDGTYPADSEGFDVHTYDSVFNVLKSSATRITAKNNP
jgi:Endo-beta-mannanase